MRIVQPPFLSRSAALLPLDFNINFPRQVDESDTRYATDAARDDWKQLTAGKSLMVTVSFAFHQSYNGSYFYEYAAAGTFTARITVGTGRCWSIFPADSLGLATLSTSYSPAGPAAVGTSTSRYHDGSSPFSGTITGTLNAELYIDMRRNLAGELKVIASLSYAVVLHIPDFNFGDSTNGSGGYLLSGDFQKWLDTGLPLGGEAGDYSTVCSSVPIAGVGGTLIDSGYVSDSTADSMISSSSSATANWE